jgi:hypothetical protein
MAKGQRKHLKEMKKVDNAIKERADKEEKKNEFRKMTIEQKRNEITERMNIWDKRRTDVKNKEFLITTDDYRNFVPKTKQHSL